MDKYDVGYGIYPYSKGEETGGPSGLVATIEVKYMKLFSLRVPPISRLSQPPATALAQTNRPKPKMLRIWLPQWERGNTSPTHFQLLVDYLLRKLRSSSDTRYMNNASQETVWIENLDGEWMLVVSGTIVCATRSRIEIITKASAYQIRTGRIVENLSAVCAE